jgi:fructosamine-3-kinase
MTDAVAAVRALTGQIGVAARPLAGTVCQVRLASGATVVAKRGTGTGMVTAEAASLRWLADAHTVAVPDVLGEDGHWLVLTAIEQARPSPGVAEDFGRRLAALHASGAPAFGAPPPGGPRDAWIGMAAMVDEPMADWPQWYAEYRIRPYARRSPRLLDVGLFERVCARLPELAGPPEPPARLHGDLWNGNVVWGADGQAWVIDPAAHGGHRETDLAMLALFGCPHLEHVLGAYREVAPLADGWADRVALHQLFPLLVHTELFGGGYSAQATAAAQRALRA